MFVLMIYSGLVFILSWGTSNKVLFDYNAPLIILFYGILSFIQIGYASQFFD